MNAVSPRRKTRDGDFFKAEIRRACLLDASDLRCAMIRTPRSDSPAFARAKAGLAEEDVSQTLSGYKETRDRCYALAKQSLVELRAFAKFAFRGDTTNARRALFFSAYNLRINRKYRNNVASASAEAISLS